MIKLVNAIDSAHAVGQISRRRAIAVLAGGGSAALLAACMGPSVPAGPAATATAVQPAAAAQAATQPKSGGTLRMGVLGDLQNLDGHVTTGLESRNRIWNTLTSLDEKLQTLPQLAERFDLSPDARRMTLGLRQGVQFHTGRELTSEDVAWNFGRLKDPKVNPIYANLVKPFATIQTPDKYTVSVEFDAPNPFVVDALPALPMIDPVTFQQSGAETPVGTGPFRYIEWRQGDHISLKRHDGYWDRGKPYMDALEVKIFSDPQTMITEYESGGLDVAVQPALTDWVRLQKAQNDQALLNSNSGNYLAVAFNTTQPPTNDKLVRQALQYSFDRQRFAGTVYQGVEKPVALLWFPSSPAYDAAKNNVYPFDLDKAKALLAQAGQAGLTFDYNYPSTAPDHAQIGQIWQQDLARIGVTLNLRPTDPVALTNALIRTTYQGVAVGVGFFGQLHGGVVWTSPYYGPVNNRSGFKDEQYTQLTLRVYTEADPARLKQALSDWNNYVMDQSFVTAIATQFPRAVAKPNVRGVTFNTGGTYLDVTQAWLA